jgi:hypothetical protein
MRKIGSKKLGKNYLKSTQNILYLIEIRDIVEQKKHISLNSV